MENNDLIVRLRYALELKNAEIEEIFSLGGVELSRLDVVDILSKTQEEEEEADYALKINNQKFDAFLNGLIIYKRGRQEPKPGHQAPAQAPADNEPPNNLLLKKVKIALSLTTEDMIDILAKAGVQITKGELGALLRKKGHKNYKECGDKYARNFLKGLALKYRNPGS